MNCPEPGGCLLVLGRCDEGGRVEEDRVEVRMSEYRSTMVKAMVRERLGCSPSE